MNTLLFQYCQKIIVLSKDKKQVLLCKRKGEQDYDGIYSFIGGKMETSDNTIIDGLQREKNEEVGENFKILIYPNYSTNLLFRKKDGNSMILPHYISIYHEGEIQLNEEYSEYQWIDIDKLNQFEPKIENIPESLEKMMKLLNIIDENDYILI